MKTMHEQKQYALHIDGKLFRAQRSLLIAITNFARQQQRPMIIHRGVRGIEPGTRLDSPHA
jgi:hypothetical protein